MLWRWLRVLLVRRGGVVLVPGVVVVDLELQGVAASFYKALLKGELSCTPQCLVDHEPRKNDPEAFKAALELHGPDNFRRALELGKAPKRSADEVSPSELMEFAKAFNSGSGNDWKLSTE